MAYASYRCLVAAPVSAIWKSLREIYSRSLQKDEEPFVDHEKHEIIIRLKGASARGERRLAIRAQDHGAVVESVLRWDTDNPDLERELMRTRVESLVRDLVLDVKKLAEAS